MFLVWMMNELLNVCWRMSCWCQHARTTANPKLNSPAKVPHLLFFFHLVSQTPSPLLLASSSFPSFLSHALSGSIFPYCHNAHTLQHAVCVLSQLVCMPAAAIPASLWKSRRNRGVYAERGERKKEQGEERGRRRGREVIETEREMERGIGMPQGEMKKQRKK